MSEEFQIQLNIADKYYPLNCRRSEEGIIRKAASNVNDRLREYDKVYARAGFERNDLLSLVAFHFSLENSAAKKSRDIAPLFAGIGRLCEELDEYLLNN